MVRTPACTVLNPNWLGKYDLRDLVHPVDAERKFPVQPFFHSGVVAPEPGNYAAFIGVHRVYSGCNNGHGNRHYNKQNNQPALNLWRLRFLRGYILILT